jgi:branched-chain amino acid transport system permease protein
MDLSLFVTRERAIGAAVALGVVAILVLRGQKEALVIGIITGAAYGLVALGLVLVYKSSGVFNFAQGEFGTVAVFALYLFHLWGLPYVLALFGALAVAVAMGLLTERLVIRPLFDAPRVTLLVATAGVSLLAIGVEIWFGEARLRGIDPALTRFDRVSLLGVQISDQRLLLLLTLAILAVVLAWFFNRTNLGLAILGASQEPTATELVGISVRRLSSLTWALAAFLGGLAGVIAVPVTGSFGPGVVTSGLLIPAFTAAVIGGFTSLPGAFLGGTIVGVAQSWATTDNIFDFVPGQAGTVIVFVLLVGILTVKPSGLLGRAA